MERIVKDATLCFLLAIWKYIFRRRKAYNRFLLTDHLTILNSVVSSSRLIHLSPPLFFWRSLKWPVPFFIYNFLFTYFLSNLGNNGDRPKKLLLHSLIFFSKKFHGFLRLVVQSLSWGRFASPLSYSSCFLQQTSDNTVQTPLRRPSASSLSRSE